MGENGRERSDARATAGAAAASARWGRSGKSVFCCRRRRFEDRPHPELFRSSSLSFIYSLRHHSRGRLVRGLAPPWLSLGSYRIMLGEWVPMEDGGREGRGRGCWRKVTAERMIGCNKAAPSVLAPAVDAQGSSFPLPFSSFPPLLSFTLPYYVPSIPWWPLRLPVANAAPPNHPPPTASLAPLHPSLTVPSSVPDHPPKITLWNIWSTTPD